MPIIIASALAYAWCWLMLWLINQIYPEHQDIMQGFPYQGHVIMTALLIGAAVISSSVYGWFNRHNSDRQLFQSAENIFMWLIVLLPLIYIMPGSGMLIWPVLLSIVLLITGLHLPKLAEQLAPVFAVLNFVLLGTLLVNLPIALGMAALPLTAVVVVWLLALSVPVISPIKKIHHGLILLFLPMAYLAFTLFSTPSISTNHPHPTSLSYLYDYDTQQGHFFNYDVVNSGWNDDIFQHANDNQELYGFRGRYKKPVRHLSELKPAVPIKAIEITAKKPLRQGKNLIIDLIITAHRNTEVLEIYTNQAITIHK
jgi:hypothetical protein